MNWNKALQVPSNGTSLWKAAAPLAKGKIDWSRITAGKTVRRIWLSFASLQPRHPVSTIPLKSRWVVTTHPRALFTKGHSDFWGTVQAISALTLTSFFSSLKEQRTVPCLHHYLLDVGCLLTLQGGFPNAQCAQCTAWLPSTKSMSRGKGGPHNFDHTQVGAKHCSEWNNKGKASRLLTRSLSEPWFVGCIPKQKSFPVGTCSD